MRNHMLKTGGAAIALTLVTIGTAVHSNSSDVAVTKQAASDASDAARALAKGKAEAAVGYAEHAVQLRPQDAGYRALLGKVYLAAGRFFSAKQAFADALQLDPNQPGAALSLALATTATGDFSAAQEILNANAGTISPADRGLAYALAGNPAAAVEILLPAARGPASDAKTRQNLALAFALAGRWPDARQVALADLSPADADARIEQWAGFARPTAASDQVASLLNVTPVADGGLPVRLALNTASPVQTAAAAPAEPVAEAAPAPVVVAAVSAPVEAVSAPVETVAVAAAAPAVSGVVFGERREVVQKLPVAVAAVAPAPRMARGGKPAAAPVAIAASAPAKGDFYVQLGAYDSAAMAKWGWDRAKARYASLKGKTPYTMPIGNGLMRVAVGGFARNDAVSMCRSIRAKGGACFVRANAGDRVASWVNGNVQVAAKSAGRVTRLASR